MYYKKVCTHIKMTLKDNRERARDIAITYKSRGCDDCGNTCYDDLEYKDRDKVRRLIKNGSTKRLEEALLMGGITCKYCRLGIKKKINKNISVTTRLDDQLADWLEDMAKSDGISKSSLLRRLIREEHIRRLHGE